MLPALFRDGQAVPETPQPLGSVADPWVSSSGDVVAHPSAPRGGSGLGDSKGARPLGLSNDPFDSLPHPLAPDARKLDPNLLGDKAEELDTTDPQPAPIVSKNEKKTINGVPVTIEADKTGQSGFTGAQTSFGLDAGALPESEIDNKTNKVTKILGSLPSITGTIGTSYAKGANVSGKSAYGRGTTDDDKKKGNVTLGFHESCHRQDHQDFLKANALPKFPGKVGNTEKEWNDAYDAYVEAVEAYTKKSHTNTFNVTEEVGNPTKSQFEKKP